MDRKSERGRGREREKGRGGWVGRVMAHLYQHLVRLGWIRGGGRGAGGGQQNQRGAVRERDDSIGRLGRGRASHSLRRERERERERERDSGRRSPRPIMTSSSIPSRPRLLELHVLLVVHRRHLDGTRAGLPAVHELPKRRRETPRRPTERRSRPRAGASRLESGGEFPAARPAQGRRPGSVGIAASEGTSLPVGVGWELSPPPTTFFSRILAQRRL